jgi:hypothetical protein
MFPVLENKENIYIFRFVIILDSGISLLCTRVFQIEL